MIIGEFDKNHSQSRYIISLKNNEITN
jgi:hypothetical protein